MPILRLVSWVDTKIHELSSQYPSASGDHLNENVKNVCQVCKAIEATATMDNKRYFSMNFSNLEIRLHTSENRKTDGLDLNSLLSTTRRRFWQNSKEQHWNENNISTQSRRPKPHPRQIWEHQPTFQRRQMNDAWSCTDVEDEVTFRPNRRELEVRSRNNWTSSQPSSCWNNTCSELLEELIKLIVHGCCWRIKVY